jgi:hypothetical protein
MFETQSPGTYTLQLDPRVKNEIVRDFYHNKLNMDPNHYGAFTVTNATSNDQKFKEIILENGKKERYELAGNELDTLLHPYYKCNLIGGRRRRSRKASKKRRKTRRHRKSRRHH